RPDPPSSLDLVGVTHNSVTLDWIPSFDGGLGQTFRISSTYVDVFPPTAAMHTVGGLKPRTTYNFSVSALNAIGESGYADQLTATTSERWEPEKPPADKEPGPPAYLTAALTVVAGVLMAFNSLGCWLAWRHKGRSRMSGQSSVLAEKKSEELWAGGSAAGGSQCCESREKINTAARRTLIADSGSETQSNVYESYGAGPRRLQEGRGRRGDHDLPFELRGELV
ncbi:hypothetical protein CRUP_001354, partial [Coryphaenoides rupestris]